MDDKKLTRNAARCLACNTVIESKHVHDWQSCKCGKHFVDGGLCYIRRTVGDDLEDLSEYKEPTDGQE